MEIAQPIIDREAPAGHLVLYPASSLGMVTPVTRGVRGVSFFWLRSMIRDGNARSLICDLDVAMPGQTHWQRRSLDREADGLYHNLTRYWAEA